MTTVWPPEWQFYKSATVIRLQLKDDIKAVRNSATQVYTPYIKEPKTSRRR